MQTTISNTNFSKLRSTHDATLVELEKYKLLVDTVEDYAIFLLDPEGYILTWNKGAQKNKGYTAEEIIGKHFSIFYLAEDNKANKPERELVLARQLGRVEDEDWRVRKDGTRFWANVVITALKDDDGTVVGYAKVTRDLTERKNNEDLLRSNNALLQKQQQDLKALNTTKDEFISLASHQLRTPATAIKQLLGMLTQGFAGEVGTKQLDLIERAYEANERQIRTVDNLLRVALIDAGKIILRKEPIILQTYLEDITREHAISLIKKDQSIELNIAKSAPRIVLIDEDHFRMALGNLIDNAGKYSHEKSKVVIKASGNNDRLFISVSDSGIGIKPEDEGLLYQKFSRIPNELSDKVGGSGLGLYWVKQVIQMHQGAISVKQKKKPAMGSTFTIELPQEANA